MNEPEHARLAPSSAPRWVPCPGSVTLQEQFPEVEDPEREQAAREGTAAHWLADELGTWQIATGNAVGLEAPNGVIIDEAMLEAATVYNDDIQTVARAALGNISASAGVSVPREFKVQAKCVHPTDNWGRTDAALAAYGEGTLYVWDFKYGWGIVEARENWQMINYGLGSLEDIQAKGHDVPKFVEFRIVQPRPYHVDGPVRVWKIATHELAEYAAKLADSAKEALGPNPTTRTNAGGCKNCSARHACGALNAAAMNAIDVSERATPALMDGPQLGKQLEEVSYALEILKARKTGLEVQASEMIKGGKQVPGWAMRSGQTKKTWTKTVAEIVGLGALYGRGLAKDSTITPAQAIKAGVPASAVNSYSEVKGGALKLVPENKNKAAEVFKND